KGNHIITSKFEHPGVLKTCQVLETKGFKITYLDITKEGIIDLNQLESKLSNNSKPILVSIMHVNNELGSIQPIKEIGALCKKHNVLFHSDCVQSFTKIPLDTKKINIDMISISSHKIHGPKGVGALWVKKGTLFKPLLSGGSQESLQRAGTENIPGIVGFSKAVEISENIDLEKIKLLKNKLIDEILKIPDTHLNGDPKSILSNFASITFKFIEGESLLMHLDLEGIQVSTGSACSSLNLQASHVLLALGLPHELCHGTIRFSLSKFTTEEDINNTINILKRVIPELRKISPFKKSYDNYEKLKN
ncbi:cysteine desulfurase, partial [Candidatus Woesearchaeota archaeon]|nr:cysteine desulfurase [Candidatus Woesearchaeota archaeon]